MRQSALTIGLSLSLLLGIGCTPSTPPAPSPNAASPNAGGPASSASSSTTSAKPTSDESPETGSPDANEPAPEKTEGAKSEENAGSEPRLQVATWAQAEELIASHSGKLVVLDFWSNFCPPCIEELPKLGKIHEEFGDQVVCLSFNCNFSGDGKPEDERDSILQVLKPMKAPFLTLISADKDVDLYEKLGIASIPVVRVYGRDGKLAKQFDNEKGEYGPDGFTYQKHVHPYVAELVKK